MYHDEYSDLLASWMFCAYAYAENNTVAVHYGSLCYTSFDAEIVVNESAANVI